MVAILTTLGMGKNLEMASEISETILMVPGIAENVCVVKNEYIEVILVESEHYP